MSKKAIEKTQLKMNEGLLRPGMRLAVGLSGGADSVALTLSLAERARELGLVLSVAHLHHGLRGAEADGDAEFCRELAGRLGVPFHCKRVAVEAVARERGATIEEAAREARYAWFRELMRGGAVDAVATAHTLDDQAETVLGKILRGAWMEGMGGIYPVLEFAEGRVVRPLLGARRSEIEAWLMARGERWREDSSNKNLNFTRNSLRHELLPELERWNKRVKEHLAQMAELARDEESWIEGLIAKEAVWAVKEGKPVRGGGRGESLSCVALELERMKAQPVAVRRRLIRLAAERLGVKLNFEATEGVRRLGESGRAGDKYEAEGGLRVERSARELRLTIVAGARSEAEIEEPVEFAVPGEAEGFGVRLRVESAMVGRAVLRSWKAGDRVRLKYTSGEKKVKEVLERMQVRGTERAVWPVVEMGGRIVWMKGVEIEAVAAVKVSAVP